MAPDSSWSIQNRTGSAGAVRNLCPRYVAGGSGKLLCTFGDSHVPAPESCLDTPSVWIMQTRSPCYDLCLVCVDRSHRHQLRQRQRWQWLMPLSNQPQPLPRLACRSSVLDVRAPWSLTGRRKGIIRCGCVRTSDWQRFESSRACSAGM